MPLDKPGLAAALLVAFDKGMTVPDWSKDDAAQALADAIDTYVRGASVEGVAVTLTDGGGAVIGQGVQNAPGVLT